MPLITAEQKSLDPNWYDHVRPGDYFHTGNPSRCGICGCATDFFEIVRWMGGYPKLHMLCPGNQVNSELHQRIDRKKDFLRKDVLPANSVSELKREIASMIIRLHTEVAAAGKAL
jgi:hypothetical protein